jgi:transposase-like protein
VPEDQWPEFKARAIACYQAAAPALARMLRDDIAATYGTALPSALTCLQDDFEACITHLRFPLAHRRAIRTTNLLERSARKSSMGAIGTALASRPASGRFSSTCRSSIQSSTL